MSRSMQQAMIDRDHRQLSLVRQCRLVNVSRASVYYRPAPTSAEDLELMALMEGAPELFGDNHKSQEKAKEAQIDQLYRHIGQLKVERDFLSEVYELQPAAGHD